MIQFFFGKGGLCNDVFVGAFSFFFLPCRCSYTVVFFRKSPHITSIDQKSTMFFILHRYGLRGALRFQAASYYNKWFTLKLTGSPQNIMRNADMLITLTHHVSGLRNGI